LEGLKRNAQQKLHCKKGEYRRIETMPFREESVKGRVENKCPSWF
jgi:hypothetical protein